MASFEKEARQAYEEKFERKVVSVGHPAGKRKKSIRLFLEGGGSVIATQRGSTDHAELEINVLRALNAHDAPVPKILSFDGKLLFQEDLGTTRLSMALSTASPAKVEQLLATAIVSLAKTHAAAKLAGLKRHVVTLDGEEFRANLLAVPEKLGKALELPAPDIPMKKLDERLRVASPEFVKWDARPPNAIVQEDGNVSWIDWEHCGRRNRLDDLVWLLGDQGCPDIPDVEKRSFDQHIPLFVDGMEIEDARDYLAAYGVLHMCVRLGLSLKSLQKNGTKDLKSVQTKDANLLAHAHRSTVRASRWALNSPLTTGLSPWLSEIAHQIEEARQDNNNRADALFNDDWKTWVEINIDNGVDKNFIFQALLDARFEYHFIKEKMDFEPLQLKSSEQSVSMECPAIGVPPVPVSALRDGFEAR